MNEQLERQIQADFPFMKTNKIDGEENLYRRWGCDCDDGWYDLIHDMCQAITDRHLNFKHRKRIPVLFILFFIRSSRCHSLFVAGFTQSSPPAQIPSDSRRIRAAAFLADRFALCLIGSDDLRDVAPQLFCAIVKRRFIPGILHKSTVTYAVFAWSVRYRAKSYSVFVIL